jgi:hypothetical protein
MPNSLFGTELGVAVGRLFSRAIIVFLSGAGARMKRTALAE